MQRQLERVEDLILHGSIVTTFYQVYPKSRVRYGTATRNEFNSCKKYGNALK